MKTRMGEAVTKYYRRLLRTDFENAGSFENVSIFVELIETKHDGSRLFERILPALKLLYVDGADLVLRCFRNWIKDGISQLVNRRLLVMESHEDDPRRNPVGYSHVCHDGAPARGQSHHVALGEADVRGVCGVDLRQFARAERI